MGVRTIFNLLGPLLNPAGAGVSKLIRCGKLDLLDRMAGAVARLGVCQACLVCGKDGMDEVSLSGPTHVRWVVDGRIVALEWTPENFGLEARVCEGSACRRAR